MIKRLLYVLWMILMFVPLAISVLFIWIVLFFAWIIKGGRFAERIEDSYFDFIYKLMVEMWGEL